MEFQQEMQNELEMQQQAYKEAVAAMFARQQQLSIRHMHVPSYPQQETIDHSGCAPDAALPLLPPLVNHMHELQSVAAGGWDQNPHTLQLDEVCEPACSPAGFWKEVMQTVSEMADKNHGMH